MPKYVPHWHDWVKRGDEWQCSICGKTITEMEKEEVDA